MFDDDDSGAISLEEFLRVTTALRSRLRRVSHLRRTGLQTDECVHPSDPIISPITTVHAGTCEECADCFVHAILLFGTMFT